MNAFLSQMRIKWIKGWQEVLCTAKRELWRQISHHSFLIGLLSLIWLGFRTGPKPSRAIYPCQQVAAANSYLWLVTYAFPLISAIKQKIATPSFGKKSVIACFVLALILSALWSQDRLGGGYSTLALEDQTAQLSFAAKLAESQPASDIFVVNGTSGNDQGVSELIDLMGNHGSPFYKSPATGKNKGSSGFIARDDTLIIKVNSQWDERGGTNTDLLKSLIQTIVDHPDGFVGEIVVADNGQAQYGSTGRGGSLDYSRNNAEDISQSVQKVVDFFADYRVSTYLWDNITTIRVEEYSEGNVDDGYVINTTVSETTGVMVSYPKFKTKFGTYISFKLGIWNPETQTYDSDHLKVVNVPVLKSHSFYGVTACVKHYMGVGSDKLTAQLGSRMHNTVGTGGMGVEMAETRFPVLNIVDAIWVNARPGGGPMTSYKAAIRTNVIAASTDPVALDYWAAKNVLMPAAQEKGYGNLSSIDPDNTRPRSFGQWLKLSMEEIRRAGYQTTVEESHMNIYVSALQPTSQAPTPTPTPTPTPPPPKTEKPSPSINWTYLLVGIIVMVILGAGTAGVIISRKKRQRP